MAFILVTGGAGYIGSHTCLALAKQGYQPVVVDNYINSQPESLRRVMKLSETTFPVVEADIRDTDKITSVLQDYDCEAVIHFAGLKAVGDSSEKPLEYYSANVVGTHSLLTAMKAAGTEGIVFSSSATVYGEPEFLPCTEDHPLAPTNPYGQTKFIIELMLRDIAVAGNGPEAAILRYFNPIGAHPSGEIGEDPNGIPNNLMPFVAQVAVGRREELSIWGNDYDTPDGTGVRDYIHVVDLAEAHIVALRKLMADKTTFEVNLGSGKGASVLEVVEAFEAASGKDIPLKFAPRRAGDIASSYADPSKAEKLLNWRTSRSLEDMCRDQWAWQRRNPNGYANP